MIQIANAPCSWGVLEFDSAVESPGYVQVLDEMQATGYAGTELGDWGFMPTEPDRLQAELAERRLALVAAFVPVALADPATHAQGEAEALKVATLLAAVAGQTPFIVLSDDCGKEAVRTSHAGRIQPEHALSQAQWQMFGRGVERIARAVRDQTGLRTVFHPHCAGYVETPAEVDRLLMLTDADLVGLCLDTGHLRFAGGDPLAAIALYGNRIWHVHFKDCQPELAARSRTQKWDYFTSVRNGIFCELGQGDVDFKAVIDQLKAQEYQGWIVVEQDVLPGMGTPQQSARRNRNYLRQIGM
jgi:inosose dehydratase